MNYFMRKSLHQNQSTLKDHYYLPDQDGEQNDEASQFSEQGPLQKIIISNFAENAKITIDIVIDDIQKTQKQDIEVPKIRHKSPIRKYWAQKGNHHQMEGNDDHKSSETTALKASKYSYDHSYNDKNPQISSKYAEKFKYNHEYPIAEIGIKNNLLYEDKRNIRYFNTQVIYPISLSPSVRNDFSDSHQKCPQEDEIIIHTPFPSSQEKEPSPKQEKVFSQKKVLIPNWHSLPEPKQKSFYKVSQFNLSQINNQKKEQSVIKSHAQSNKLQNIFEQMQSQFYQNGDKVHAQTKKEKFFVREQISGDFIQQRGDNHEERYEFEGPNQEIQSQASIVDSQIADQIQHCQNPMRKINSRGQIEDLIMQNYRVDVPQKAQQMNEKNSQVTFPQSQKKILEQSQSHGLIHNESLTKLKVINNFQIDKQHCSFIDHSSSKEENFKISKEDIQNKLKNEDGNISVLKYDGIQDFEAAAGGKWNKNKNDIKDLKKETINLKPQQIQVEQLSEVQEQNRNILNESQQNFKHQISVNQEDLSHSKLNLKLISSRNHLQESVNEINELSEIQKLSPRIPPESPSNYYKKSFQRSYLYQQINGQDSNQEIHQKKSQYDQDLQQQDASSQLKHESNISYNFTPSPKRRQNSNQPNQQKDPTNHLQKNQEKSAHLSLTLNQTQLISQSRQNINSNNRSKSKSNEKSREYHYSGKRTYYELEKYKRLFCKKDSKNNSNNSINTKNPQISPHADTQSSIYLHHHQSDTKHHHHKNHCLVSTQPANFKFKDYSSTKDLFIEKPINSVRANQSQQSSQQNEQKFIANVEGEKKNEWITPKVVKINLSNRKAEDLFTQHKNQFLNKLKQNQRQHDAMLKTFKEKQSYDRSKSRTNPCIQVKLNIYHANTHHGESTQRQSPRARQLSPYIQNLSKRLSSPKTHQPICQNYKKHTKRDLRNNFLNFLQKDSNKPFLRQYYLSQDQLNEIFVQEILNKEINEIYWIQIVKEWGQRKLSNMRLRSKSKYNPNQKKIIRQEQLLMDTKRANHNMTQKLSLS